MVAAFVLGALGFFASIDVYSKTFELEKRTAELEATLRKISTTKQTEPGRTKISRARSISKRNLTPGAYSSGLERYALLVCGGSSLKSFARPSTMSSVTV